MPDNGIIMLNISMMITTTSTDNDVASTPTNLRGLRTTDMSQCTLVFTSKALSRCPPPTRCMGSIARARS